MIRALFWQVLQNVFRLGVIVGIPAIFLWQGGFLEEKADRLPWWVIIGIGALIGGFVSTPATNIGNLVWAILGAYLRETIGGKRLKDAPRRKLAYLENWNTEVGSVATAVKRFPDRR